MYAWSGQENSDFGDLRSQALQAANPYPVYGELFWKQRSWHTFEGACYEVLVSSNTIHESEGVVLLMLFFC